MAEHLTQFPSNIKFKYTWRTYQERVLNELEEHLDDNHLHIVAPPGSGKTALGLEVALRLNKPTLIFAPTLAIRNQWVKRFCELFLQVKNAPDWISKDIRNPRFLTVVTYQSLHAACSGEVGLEDEDAEEETNDQEVELDNAEPQVSAVIERLLAEKIGTIVVDEAHHLKNAWWKTLTEVKTALNPTVVGLTATPPYDVSHSEWSRYLELNGPVDAEISVPELVIEGDLCPHQDYIYFSNPTDAENEKITSFRKRVKIIYDEILSDTTLIEAIENHLSYQDPLNNTQWIYANVDQYSAILIYLHAVGKPIEKHHLIVVGRKDFSIPKFDYHWAEHLMSFYLFKGADHFASYEEHQNSLGRKLRRSGALERRSINFYHHKKIEGYLNSSISKLKSIERIAIFEHEHLKENLRMVILTDYIRKEFLVSQPANDLEINKIGVLPIFEQLRRNNDKSMKLGVLTGSLIIIPQAALEHFKEVASHYQIDEVKTTPLTFDSDYVLVNVTSQLKHEIVHIVTQIFQQGHIEILIGTKSLLGEGWDAPAINSLVLASFVGSYVLSNQMRGRAIRTSKMNTDKTANIWHLVCIDPSIESGGDDIDLLKRRFKAFVGVSMDEEANIENGIARLKLPKKWSNKKQVNEHNTRMLESAGKRQNLIEKWKEALSSGRVLVEEIMIPFPDEERNLKTVKKLHFRRTIQHMVFTMFSGMMFYGLSVAKSSLNALRFSSEAFGYSLLVGSGAGILIFGRFAFLNIRALLKYRDITKDIHQVSIVLLKSLIYEGTIKTEERNLKTVTTVNLDGTIYCHLEGGTTYEKSSFIKSLKEIIEPVENPRYIIIRKSLFKNLWIQKDYHSVPEIIGRQKQYAEYFEKLWLDHVGSCKLIYTRQVAGRKHLVQAQINSLASEFQDKSERVNKWTN